MTLLAGHTHACRGAHLVGREEVVDEVDVRVGMHEPQPCAGEWSGRRAAEGRGRGGRGRACERGAALALDNDGRAPRSSFVPQRGGDVPQARGREEAAVVVVVKVGRSRSVSRCATPPHERASERESTRACASLAWIARVDCVEQAGGVRRGAERQARQRRAAIGAVVVGAGGGGVVGWLLRRWRRSDGIIAVITAVVSLPLGREAHRSRRRAGSIHVIHDAAPLQAN